VLNFGNWYQTNVCSNWKKLSDFCYF
jgi:hypothetical protein